MDNTDLMIYLVSGVFVFTGMAFMLRWILGLDGMYKRQQYMLRVLEKIAIKQGVTLEELKKVQDSLWS